MSFKENVAKCQIFGAGFPFSIGVFATQEDLKTKDLKTQYARATQKDSGAYEAFVAATLISSQLAFLGYVFGVAFGIAKHAIGKTNAESLKIGGITAGVALGAMVLFCIADCLIRSKVLKQDEAFDEAFDEVFGDFFVVEAIATLGVPALLGLAQVKIHEACTGNKRLIK